MGNSKFFFSATNLESDLSKQNPLTNQCSCQCHHRSSRSSFAAMAPTRCAFLTLLAALAFLAAAEAQCVTSPLFNKVAVPLTFCRTLTASKPTIKAAATVAWNATATGATVVVTCTNLPAKGYCSYGFSPNGKMAGADMIAGFPNPNNAAQSKVLLYTATSHTKVTPVVSGVGKLVQVTSKAVQVLSPTSVALKFTVVAKTAAFKNLYQIWAFGSGAKSFLTGALKPHANGARGSGHINLITNQ